jgi:putative sigma-54 modulation protein
MKIEVLGKNGFTPSEANREYAEKKLAKLDGRIPDADLTRARVVCKVYKTFHKVEITIPVKGGRILRSEVSDVDIYAAIDKSIDKLLTQVRRHNDRVKDKLGKTSIRYAEEPTDVAVSEPEPKVSRSKKVELEPMTKEEAIDQMELLGHDFFVYLDKETMKTNVIYLRDDGDYAVIETESK